MTHPPPPPQSTGIYIAAIDNIILNKFIVLYTCWNQITLITDGGMIQ